MKEHRSERPAIWDYSNPREEKRVSLRKRLAAPLKASPPASAKASAGPRLQKVRKKK
jgi:hypothetical protein